MSHLRIFRHSVPPPTGAGKAPRAKPVAQRLALLVVALAGAGTLQQAQAQYSSIPQGYWTPYKLEYDGANTTHIGNGSPDDIRPWDSQRGWGSGNADLRAEPNTVEGYARNAGKVRPWFRWVRRTIAQNNGRYTMYVSDPSDNPPASFLIGITASAYGGAKSDYVNGGPNPALNRIPSKEHATISLFGDTATGQEDPASDATTARLVVGKARLVAGAAVQTSPEGYEVVPGPWLDLKAEGKLDGDRYGNVNGYGSGGLGGYVRSSLSFGSTTISLEPSPQNIALDDGSTKGLNQFTIDAGIPARVTINSPDAILAEEIRKNSSWSLSGTAPALRPFADNFKDVGQSSAIVGPQHPGIATSTTQNPTPAPENGLKFDVRIPNTYPSYASDDGWKFPADNSKFGEKTLNHIVGGTTIPAPVALFFPWNGYQHPKGGPKGVHIYQDSAGVEHEMPINTPNWFYYYDKAWPNPWGIPLTFWDKNTSFSITNSTGEHMYVGYDTHGSNTDQIETDLFAFVPGLTGLRWVGSESTRGIDVYKRVISHECTHLLITRMREASDPLTNAPLYPDNDPDPNGYPVGDRLPDVLETYLSESSRGNGLSPLIRDTTGWAAAYNAVEYGPYPDEEVFCRMTERGLFGPMDQDWASDGLNYGRPVSPNRLQRTAPHFPAGYNGNSLTFPSPGSVPVLPAPTPVPTPPAGGTP